MIFFRDGLEESIDAAPRVRTTRAGHVVEEYKVKGEKRFFVTLKGTHLCAHGNTLAEAVTDALWKDEANRPSLEALRDEIKAAGKNRKITLNEFRILTGACQEGCRVALKRAGLDGAPMKAFEVRKYFPEWGEKLLRVLEWN